MIVHTYELNKIPIVDNNSYASIDLEMYEQKLELLHIPHGKFACLSISMEDGTNYLINDDNLLQQTMDELAKVPEWIFQNAVYDLTQLKALCTLDDLHFIWDTMIVEKILWSGYYVNFSLKDMVRRYFGEILLKDKYEDIQDRTISATELNNYAIDDAVKTRMVREVQYKLLTEDKLSYNVYKTLESPMCWIASSMQPTKVNAEEWTEFSKLNQALATSIEMEIGVNTYSPKKVIERLRQEGIVVESTGDEILAEYAGNYVVDKIRECRGLRKNVSTYGEKWLENNVIDGVVRSSWKTYGTMTGRISSSNPNLQQIPSRKTPKFRDFFIPNEDVLIVADISQQEPRFTALISGDKTLTDIFRNKEDIHSGVTKEIFGLDEVDKKDSRRKVGKETGLGVVYGLTADGLRSNLKEKAPELFSDGKNLTVADCQEFIDKYFNRFPKVRNMVDRLKTEGFKREHVRTPFGRKVWINTHSNGWENACVNYPHQGGGADMTKAWLISIYKETKERGIPFGVCMTVHDEVVLDVKKELLDEYLDVVDKAFSTAVELIVPDSPVPFVYEVGHGDKWSCKE